MAWGSGQSARRVVGVGWSNRIGEWGGRVSVAMAVRPEWWQVVWERGDGGHCETHGEGDWDR